MATRTEIRINGNYFPSMAMTWDEIKSYGFTLDSAITAFERDGTKVIAFFKYDLRKESWGNIPTTWVHTFEPLSRILEIENSINATSIQ